jgi:tetratricopeptide (TPR) repeat protein
MTVRHRSALAFLLIAALGLAGCGGGDKGPLIGETDEHLYQEAKQLERQGRYAEALLRYNRLIEKRGGQAAPESHLDAGNILLEQIHDPVEAIHHFTKYLELQPNAGQRAQLVRERIATAKREFARTLPSSPAGLMTMSPADADEIARLQAENAELRARLQTLVGGGAAPVPPRAGRAVTFTIPEAPKPAAPVNRAPTVDESPLTMAPSSPAAPDRSVAPPAPAAATKAPAAGRRTHTVAEHETLYGISTRYYGNGRHVDEIIQANRDVLPSAAALKPGMVLKIP